MLLSSSHIVLLYDNVTVTQYLSMMPSMSCNNTVLLYDNVRILLYRLAIVLLSHYLTLLLYYSIAMLEKGNPSYTITLLCDSIAIPNMIE